MPRKTTSRSRATATGKNGAASKLKQSTMQEFLPPIRPPNSPKKNVSKPAEQEDDDEIVIIESKKTLPRASTPPRTASPSKTVRTPIKRKEEDESDVVENGKHEAGTPTVSALPRRSHTIRTPELLTELPPKKDGTLHSFLRTRKSARQVEKEKKEADIAQLYERILKGEEDAGIQIKEFAGKGRGLVAVREFEQNEYVVEYAGDLINVTKAKERERFYANQPDKYGCYMYYFKHKDKTLCVDATAETGRLGRLLNHSRSAPNLRTEVVEINKKPYLILRANRCIRIGEELQYDYGDRDAASLVAFPWLKD